VIWDGQGHFTTLYGHTVVYSGRPTRGMSGVAVWIHRKVTGALVRYEPISDRLIVVRLNAKPWNITLIQVYGPTTAATEEETERFYQDLSRAVKQVMGDLTPKLTEENCLQCHSRLGCMA